MIAALIAFGVILVLLDYRLWKQVRAVKRTLEDAAEIQRQGAKIPPAWVNGSRRGGVAGRRGR